MASIKDIKKRIGTVKNTQQTTRAMKMVSAAKLRRAQDAIQNQRPYAKGIDDLIRRLSLSEGVGAHPLVAGHEGSPKTLLLLVTSDRGLCGGFNSNIIKAAQRWLKAPENREKAVELSFVGRRGHDFFKHRPLNIGKYYAEVGGKVTFLKAKQLSQALVDRFLDEQVSEIYVIYNEFKNAVSQQVVIEKFLPLQASQQGDLQAYLGQVKPSAPHVFEQLLVKNFAIQCFRILLESQAGEHGARMSAMENATKNAGQMISKLTLQYNKQRQAGITKELLEIISGSESQKSE